MMTRVGCAGARLRSERALSHSDLSDAPLLRTDESKLLFMSSAHCGLEGQKHSIRREFF